MIKEQKNKIIKIYGNTKKTRTAGQYAYEKDKFAEDREAPGHQSQNARRPQIQEEPSRVIISKRSRGGPRCGREFPR